MDDHNAVLHKDFLVAARGAGRVCPLADFPDGRRGAVSRNIVRRRRGLFLAVNLTQIIAEVDGHGVQIFTRVGCIGDCICEQLRQLSIGAQLPADFIVQAIALHDVLSSTVLLRLKVNFQRRGNIVTDRILVDVVLFRIAQPQIGADRVSVLIMAVPCAVIVCDTDFFGSSLKIGDALRQILRFIKQTAEHLPHGLALRSRHGDQHAVCEEMCGVQQAACLRQSLRQHVRTIRRVDVPVLPKALDRFPFAAYAAVD